MMNAELILGALPFLDALNADTLDENMRLHEDAMEDLVATFEPHELELCWAYAIEPLLRLLRRYGAPAMVDAASRLGRLCDLFTLEQLLKRDDERRTLALYHAELTWLATAQLHALLGGGAYDVPDPIEGVLM